MSKNKNMNKEMSAGKYLGVGMKIALAISVLLFMGLHSFNLFTFVFGEDKFYYAILGFSLTSGAFVAYLVMFLKEAETELQKVIAVVMMVISLFGEAGTAMFGMQIEAWEKAGWALTQSEFDMMITSVGILGFAHGIALVLYIAGDEVIELFSEVKVYRKNKKQKNNKQQKVYTEDVEAEELKEKSKN